MLKFKPMLFFILFLIIIYIIFFSACDDPVIAHETGALLITMQSYEDLTYDSLILKTSKVEVLWSLLPDGTDSRKYTVDTHQRTFVFNAQDYKFPVAQYEVPVGYIHQIRMYPEEVTVNYLGVSYSTFLPSGEQTGLKIVSEYGTPFFVEHNETSMILCKFNFQERIVKTKGKHEFILHPTIPANYVLPEDMGGILPDIVKITVEDGVTRADVEAICETKGVTITHTILDIGYYVLKLPACFPLNEAIDYFNSLSIVKVASISSKFRLSAIPNDGGVGLNYQACQQTVDLEHAWDDETGDRNVVIAILDSGAQLDHRDLINNIWINQGELPSSLSFVDTDSDGRISFIDLNHPSNSSLSIPDTNGNGLVDPVDILNDSRFCNKVDNDGNGYIDDFCGYDFVDKPFFFGNGGDNNPYDTATVSGFSHGTSVAGVAGAVANNALDISGTAWNISLMIVRISTANEGYDYEAEQGIKYALINDADIINMSFGATYQRKKQDHDDIYRVDYTSPSWSCYLGYRELQLNDFMFRVVVSNSIFVVSSGNEDVNLGDIDTYGWYAEAMDNSVFSSHLIVVGGTNQAGDSIVYNFGGSVDLYAPAQTWVLLDFYPNVTTPTNTTLINSGTSYSAPLVSGTLGLMLSYNNRQYQGNYKYRDVIRIIKDSCDITHNYKLLNSDEALNNL